MVQPFFTMVVFSVIFGAVVKMPSDGVPYPIFSYAALVPWTFSPEGWGRAAHNLVGNSNLIRKVYFPRLAIPIAAVLSGVVDFVLAFATLVCMMLFYGIVPTANMVWLPFLMALAFVSALALSL
ncbi:MAG: hypothetical protein U0411_06315 [Thermodesulfovibrionales bacterium]